ncbi:serine protease [Okeania sp.]|uniref:S1 family peptidase n=1 Tax=Okeania sp. TaxID=3100323 RepID=UPI002B4AB272|nr:serine protease [Okeania sp.]MEB3343674.1 serine protease [Okeania sp.]
MILFKQFSISVICFLTVLRISIPSVLALTKEQVDAIAWQVSVIYGPGLTKEQIKSIDNGDYSVVKGWQNGSGVIIGRQGETYYVLSALHVVADSRGGTFALATPDREVHVIDDEKTKSNIIPLGKPQGMGESIDGLDLVLIKFNSKEKYEVAPIAISENLQAGSPIYVNGWPNPEDLSDTKRERRFEEGKVSFVAKSPSSNGGYSFLYSSWTASGMSGGAIFNSEGQVIGIHGRGRARGDVYCVNFEFSQNNSCGMQIFHFLSHNDAKTINSALNTAIPVDPKIVENGIKGESKTDKIDNIYKTFAVEFVDSGTRRKPSGGCDFLLIDDCE